MLKHLKLLPCALLLTAAPLLGQQPVRLRAQSATASQAVSQAPPTPLPPGDATRGKALFESNGCFDCHRVGDKGSHLGPDLTDIGGRRAPDKLRLALVSPDEDVLPENRFVKAVTKGGETVTGRLLNQDAISVQLINPKDQLKSYLKANLKEFAIVDKGMMPSVQGKLTEPQINDIVNYLASLKPAGSG